MNVTATTGCAQCAEAWAFVSWNLYGPQQHIGLNAQWVYLYLLCCWWFADVESGPRKVPTPAASRLQIELRKPSSSGGVAAVQPPAPMEPVLADSVVESIKEPETGLKEKEEDQAQGSAVLTVAAANAAEDSGDAIEGPLSTKDEVVGAETVVGNVGGLGRDEEEKPGFVFDEGEAGKMMSKNMEPTSFKEADGVAVESEVSKGVFRALRNVTKFSTGLGLENRATLSCNIDCDGLIHTETFICTTTPLLDIVVQQDDSLSLSPPIRSLLCGIICNNFFSVCSTSVLCCRVDRLVWLTVCIHTYLIAFIGWDAS